MKEFFFKLFKLEWEKEECDSCNRLMLLLEEEKRLNKRLIDELLVKPEEVVKIEQEEWKPLIKNTSWASTKARLESEDRHRAEEIRKKNSIETLEKELGVKVSAEEESA